jgi:photosystem II stability/assembly factor-like uncharacterized protein
MSIDDRLREAFRRASGSAHPSERAWTSIERGIDHRRRRSNAVRVGIGSVVAVGFVGGIAWAGLTLHHHRPAHLAASGGQTLVVSDVKVAPSRIQGPGEAKVYGSVTNNGSDPTGAAITCTLEDANGNSVANATSSVDYVAAGATQTFATAAAYQATPATASCSAKARPAVSPPPKESPPPPTFRPTGMAFFDADHGIAVGNDCGRGGCTGRIEVTADGGKTWTKTADTPYALDSVTVSVTSDAWAVEELPCAYICPTVLRSTDGGRTWTSPPKRAILEQDVVNPSFPSSTVGFGFEYIRNRMSAPLMTTTDSGRTWQRVGTGCPTPTAWGTFASFVSPTHGWILCDGQPSAGQQTRVLIEMNGAVGNWQPVAGSLRGSGSSDGLCCSGYPDSLFFLPDGHGWIAENGNATILTTADGGLHWRVAASGLSDYGVGPVWFLDDRTGYALAGAGGNFNQLTNDTAKHRVSRLLVTHDGGSHWSVVHTWPGSS